MRECRFWNPNFFVYLLRPLCFIDVVQICIHQKLIDSFPFYLMKTVFERLHKNWKRLLLLFLDQLSSFYFTYSFKLGWTFCSSNSIAFPHIMSVLQYDSLDATCHPFLHCMIQHPFHSNSVKYIWVFKFSDPNPFHWNLQR